LLAYCPLSLTTLFRSPSLSSTRLRQSAAPPALRPRRPGGGTRRRRTRSGGGAGALGTEPPPRRSQARSRARGPPACAGGVGERRDRKSTRLNSSHVKI